MDEDRLEQARTVIWTDHPERYQRVAGQILDAMGVENLLAPGALRTGSPCKACGWPDVSIRRETNSWRCLQCQTEGLLPEPDDGRPRTCHGCGWSYLPGAQTTTAYCETCHALNLAIATEVQRMKVERGRRYLQFSARADRALLIGAYICAALALVWILL